MTGPYIELAITGTPALFDTFVAVFTGEGFEGFWEDGVTLRAYIPESHWTPAAKDRLQQRIMEIAAASSVPPPLFATTVIEEQNWNSRWEASITPQRITDRLVIAPSWNQPPPTEGTIVITIDPKMSFGTGYHETTRLMLQLIERYVTPGAQVLDIGTGTGVLAIAALKLGASRAVGVDNDPWSFANARENVTLNGLTLAQCTIIEGELSAVPPGLFTLVAANIQRSVITPLLPQMAARLANDGVLLLSGLLMEERAMMLNAFKEAGLRVLEELTEQEWIAFALRPGTAVE